MLRILSPLGRGVCQNRNTQSDRSDTTTHWVTVKGSTANRCQDWGEAIDVCDFYGCAEELALLEQWLVRDRCRLVMVLGMGGIGKTAISVKILKRIQEHFDYVIWRSLRNAPPILDLLADLIQFFSKHRETVFSDTVDGRISQLLGYLRASRCLLVLDNAESILRSGDRMGGYREGYEGYGQLLSCLAETPHKSTLVLTSREKPKELAAQEGETLPVRSLQLPGLSSSAGQKIFQVKGDFSGSESQWKALIEHYAGNPLALKMLAPVIRDLLD
ncbi:MAG: NB-ARC domain-containing protein, partial [Microcoleus sp.]